MNKTYGLITEHAGGLKNWILAGRRGMIRVRSIRLIRVIERNIPLDNRDIMAYRSPKGGAEEEVILPDLRFVFPFAGTQL
jgi:hypothetical protein